MLLGTDNLGRDLGWRLIGGLGISLGIGVRVSIRRSCWAWCSASSRRFFGRAADVVSNVVIDVTWAFPAILLAVVFAGSSARA